MSEESEDNKSESSNGSGSENNDSPAPENHEHYEEGKKTPPKWIETHWIFMIFYPLSCCFCFMYPLLLKGCIRPLTFESLYDMDKTQYRCTAYEKSFKKNWKIFKFLSWIRFRLAASLYACFWIEITASGLIKLLGTILVAVYPQFLKQFLMCLKPLLTGEKQNEIDDSSALVPPDMRPSNAFLKNTYRTNDWEIWIWLFVLILTQVIAYVLQNYSYFLGNRVGAKMRVLLMDQIYKKTFTLSNEGRENRDRGEVLNFLAYDCYRIDEGHGHFHEIWTSLIHFGVSCYFIVDLMGIEVMFAWIVFFLLLFLMCIGFCGIFVSRTFQLKSSDKRIAHMKETFLHMLQVKFFNREKIQEQRILKYRRLEMLFMRILYFFRSIVLVVTYGTPLIMILFTFTIYFIAKGDVENIVLLTSITYFSMMRQPMGSVSYCAATFVQAIVALRRVQNYLEEKDRDDDGEKVEEDDDDKKKPKEIELKDVDDHEYSVEVKGSFHFPMKKIQDTFRLEDLDIKIRRGDLVLIIGKTRSGKTALARTLLRETDPLDENSEVKLCSKKISYCDQTVWLENDTILNNILMCDPNETVDKKKLADVLKVCSLEEEIQKFEGGIHLEIGDNSLTLSGGQKSRIAMCRAVYYSGDIMLWDNSLSSLDEFVGNHVFQYCVLRYLREKTRILITNKYEFLPYAQQIIVLDDGKVIESGTFQELYESQGYLYDLTDGQMFEREIFDEDEEDPYDLDALLNEGTKLDELVSPISPPFRSNKVDGPPISAFEHPLSPTTGSKKFGRRINGKLKKKKFVTKISDFSKAVGEDLELFMKPDEKNEKSDDDEEEEVEGEESEESEDDSDENKEEEEEEEGEEMKSENEESDVSEEESQENEGGDEQQQEEETEGEDDDSDEDYRMEGDDIFDEAIANMKNQAEEFEAEIEDIELKKDAEETTVKISQKEERVTGFLSPKTFVSYISHTGCIIIPPEKRSTKNMCVSCCCGCGVVFLILFLYFLLVLNYFANELHISILSKKERYMKKYGNYYESTTCNDTSFDTYEYCDIDNSYHIPKLEYYNDTVNLTGIQNRTGYTYVEMKYEDVEIFWDLNFENSTVIRNGLTVTQGFIVYAGLVTCFIVYLFCIINIQYNTYLTTSHRMFKSVVKGLFGTSMSFFYSNPTGRILSRVSYDVSRTDYDLLYRIDSMTILSFLILGAFGQLILSTYGVFLPVLIVILIVLFSIYFCFRKNTIELKRLESISRSGIFHSFHQTLEGLSTIRSFPGYSERLTKDLERNINNQTRASIPLKALVYMLRTNLTLAGTGMVFVVCFFSILFSYYVPIEGIHTFLGLGIVNCVLVVDIIGIVFANYMWFEIEMNSVERLDYYISELGKIKKLKKKEDKNLKKQKLHDQIIKRKKTLELRDGRIEFKGYSARYKKEFPYILKNLDITIPSNDKILIVGTTGCGKSSIFNALLGIFEDYNIKGKILFDDRKLSHGNQTLHSIRKEISIIPQDPILFSGTLYDNLDPSGDYTEEYVMEIIEICGLKETVDRMDGKLQSVMLEYGKNFSVGEKRLFCLARALVKKSKVILLDECTGIDYNLDLRTQKICVELEDVTVLSISHRLANLLHYDKVLVMDAGEVKEFGNIFEIVSRRDSFLRNLLRNVPNGPLILRTLLERELPEEEGDSDDDENKSLVKVKRGLFTKISSYISSNDELEIFKKPDDDDDDSDELSDEKKEEKDDDDPKEQESEESESEESDIEEEIIKIIEGVEMEEEDAMDSEKEKNEDVEEKEREIHIDEEAENSV